MKKYHADECRETAEIAPVYDCGYCLYPQLATEGMQSVLDRGDEINRRIYTYPTSTIEEKGKKISYFEFISSLKNEDCNRALKRIHSRIDLEELYKIVEKTPTLLSLQKEFYKIMLHERKTKILDYSMEQLFAMEQSAQE